eukprot:592871-Rhodomonas_salina.2
MWYQEGGGSNYSGYILFYQKVWCYARTLRCPVLIVGMLLPGHARRRARSTLLPGTTPPYAHAPIALCIRYAISGTDRAYGATRRRARPKRPLREAGADRSWCELLPQIGGGAVKKDG